MGCGHRDTIFLQDAPIVERTAFPGKQYILRLRAPECARHAQPGMFVHVRCDHDIPMRRPLSIMRSDAARGWIEVLYKVVGPGLEALSARRPGDEVSVLGPIGKGFHPLTERNRVLLIGGGVGIPPLIFLAETLAADPAAGWRPVALFGSEIAFPFELVATPDCVPGISGRPDAGIRALHDIGIPSRLASKAGIPGCRDAWVTELAQSWLEALDPPCLDQVMLFACGPSAMLQAVQDLARRFHLPSQLCIEELMACGVGGCAGCTTLVHTDRGQAMQRVCVDGPVFDGSTLDCFMRQEK